MRGQAAVLIEPRSVGAPETPRLGSAPREKRTVIVSPVNLTANGRAHLGHVAGPLLRMDVLARSLKRAGHDVWSALTTDGFENHVVVKAVATGVEPAILAHRYHVQIRDDLSAVGIDFDRFDDAADADHIADFEAVKDELLQGLTAADQIALREDLLPVDDALATSASVEERFAIGGWFAARCPLCDSRAGSFFCEACGAHFEPYEAAEPASRRGAITEWVANRSYFLRLVGGGRLPRLWHETMVEAPFVEIAQRHLDAHGATIRLSLPGRYGLPWRSEELINRQVCFSYSARARRRGDLVRRLGLWTRHHRRPAVRGQARRLRLPAPEPGTPHQEHRRGADRGGLRVVDGVRAVSEPSPRPRSAPTAPRSLPAGAATARSRSSPRHCAGTCTTRAATSTKASRWGTCGHGAAR